MNTKTTTQKLMLFMQMNILVRNRVTLRELRYYA
jgi:hypothetical protein